MKSKALWAIAPLAALVALSAANAQECSAPCGTHCGSRCGQGAYYGKDHFQAYKDTVWENAIWPKQYVGPSRRGICQAYATMINNGWRKHNMLGKYHFEANSEKLSEAGKLKVEWILTQSHPHRRTIFVERALDQQQTADRVAAVQELAASMTTDGAAADIQETHLHNEGHPAAAIDAMFTGFRAGQRPPVLPESSGGSESGE